MKYSPILLLFGILMLGCYKSQMNPKAPNAPNCQKLFQSDTVTLTNAWLYSLYTCSFNEIWIMYNGKTIANTDTTGHFQLFSSFYDAFSFDVIMNKRQQVNTQFGTYQIQLIKLYTNIDWIIDQYGPDGWEAHPHTYDSAAAIVIKAL